MLPFVDVSNVIQPSIDSLIEQTMFSLISPILGFSPAVNLEDTSGSSTSTNESSPTSSRKSHKVSKTSGPMRRKRQRQKITSPIESPSTNSEMCCKTPIASKAPGPVRNRRPRKEFCNLCQKNITPEGKRSQGPGRHILQYHLCRPLFFCPHCPTTSNYDKAHIVNHMERKHKGLGGEVKVAEKHTYADVYNLWDKLCFGTVLESSVSAKIEDKTQTMPNFKISAEMDNKENSLEALALSLPATITD